MDVAATGDRGKVVKTVELVENSESLQHTKIKGCTTDAATGETDSVQLLRGGKLVNVVWLALSRRPEAAGLHLLLEQPLAGRVLQNICQAGLGSGIGTQKAGDRWIVSVTKVRYRGRLTEGIAKRV